MKQIKGVITQPILFNLDGQQMLTINTTEDVRSVYDELNGKELEITIKIYRKKRSLNANSYMWVLCEELAKLTESTQIEIYKDAIKERGVHRVWTFPEDYMPTFETLWSRQGIAWFLEKVDCDKEKPGNIIVNLYYGSSTYNTKQMARVIDYLVEECEEQGIQVLSEKELSLLKEGWQGKI